MTAFTPDQPVTVHIGGIDNDPTGHEFAYHSEALEGWINVHGFDYLFAYPAAWVVPVTPPCPWTEPGTLVRVDRRPGHDWIFVLEDDGWHSVNDGFAWDYDRDIAPYNPRRLVPEQPARPTLQTGISATLRTWLPIEGTDRWTERHGRDSGTRQQIETTYGPVTEVDGPAVTS